MNEGEQIEKKVRISDITYHIYKTNSQRLNVHIDTKFF